MLPTTSVEQYVDSSFEMGTDFFVSAVFFYAVKKTIKYMAELLMRAVFPIERLLF